MSDEAAPSTPADAASARRPVLARIAIIVGFALLYAYDLFEAVSNVIGVVQQVEAYNLVAAENDLTAVSVPWTALVVNLALPAVAFAVALVLARRRGLGVLALLLAAGLGLVAALTLSLVAVV